MNLDKFKSFWFWWIQASNPTK